MKYEFKYDYPYVKIYINDFLHLKFNKLEFIGAQSWVSGNDLFCIEYSFKNDQTILSEYDSQEKWIGVLELIEKI